MAQHQTNYVKELPAKKIHVTRVFNAPVAEVWKAWTDPAILDRWWAPKPYKTETVSMDFRVGGRWLYYMISPEGTKHYSFMDFHSIVDGESLSAMDGFCDEQGNITDVAPTMHWKTDFIVEGDNSTRVEVEISFGSESDLEKIIAMGFQEGFAMAHGNLDEYFAQV